MGHDTVRSWGPVIIFAVVLIYIYTYKCINYIIVYLFCPPIVLYHNLKNFYDINITKYPSNNKNIHHGHFYLFLHFFYYLFSPFNIVKHYMY